MLDFIYYPVSFILWCWHWVFGHVFGADNGITWALAIMFLVFTLRAIMFKPFVKQVRSMRQMQEFAPEIKKIQKKYPNDKQRAALEMQKLQREHGFSPLGGCLPMLIQIPVFIGLFHVLRSFIPGQSENYFFDAQGVESYTNAKLFGLAGLSNFVTQPLEQLTAFDVTRGGVIAVAVPLMILASVLTHLTARHSVARQNPESATPQTAIMNKVTLYIFPLGVLVFGFFFPIGLLIYWLANNSWTLMQQRIVYRRIDREEQEKKVAAAEKRASLGPKPGAKPAQAKKRPATAKPTTPSADGEAPAGKAETNGAAADKTATDKAPADKAPADKAPTDKAPTTKAPTAKASPTKAPTAKKPTATRRPANAQPASSTPSEDGTEIPGLISDRSRSKKSGRKNR